MYHVWAWCHQKSEEDIQSRWNCVKDGCEQPHLCRELNLGRRRRVPFPPPQKQQVLWLLRIISNPRVKQMLQCAQPGRTSKLQFLKRRSNMFWADIFTRFFSSIKLAKPKKAKKNTKESKEKCPFFYSNIICHPHLGWFVCFLLLPGFDFCLFETGLSFPEAGFELALQPSLVLSSWFSCF